jgi:hypothetical protein
MCEKFVNQFKKFRPAFLILLAMYGPLAQSQVSKNRCEGFRWNWVDCWGTEVTKLGVYEGEFKNGQYHGLGVQRYSDGSIYLGSFEQFLPWGWGVKIEIADGRLQKTSGYWHSGQFDSSKTRDLGLFPDDKVKVFVSSKIAVIETELINEARRSLEQAKAEELEKKERLKSRAIADQQQIQKEFEQTYGPALEKCKQLGFKKGTDKFADCVLRLSR